MRAAMPILSQPGTDAGIRRGFSLAHGLWIAAAAIVLAGFALRLLASLLGLPHLRFSGIAALALGLGIAGLGWVSERLAARHRAP